MIVVGGKPIGQALAWAGPFVMNTKDEVLQAYEDFQRGRLGSVPASVDAPTDEVEEQIDAALD